MPPNNSGIFAARAVTVPGRKLATESAWKRWNKIATSTEPERAAFLLAVATDEATQLQADTLNGLAASALALFGVTPTEGKFFELSPERGYAIPKSVWFGELSLPEVGLVPAQRAELDTITVLYRLAAGRLRKRLAVLESVFGVIADLSNSPDKPNPGGRVGEE